MSVFASRAVRYGFLAFVVLSMTACVSTRNRHGFVPERNEETLEALVGVDTQESVLARYGEPSVRPTLDGDTWYYMTFTTNARAFFRTRTTTRNVVAFQFDDEGTVVAVNEFGLEDGVPVNLVDRETPSRGKELSILEQLLGTVGQLPLPEEEAPGQ